MRYYLVDTIYGNQENIKEIIILRMRRITW